MKRFQWRMPKPCELCPFTNQETRNSLAPGRFESICRDMQRGRHFLCHASINYDRRNKGAEKVCAGAIQWQAERGIEADLVQVMRRLEIIQQREAGK
jgi:hypothetical protein